MAIVRRRALTGTLNAGGVGTNSDSGRMAAAAGRASNNCDRRRWSLSHRRRRISLSEEKTMEQNLIVRSGKSEAEVTNNERRRSRYRTAEANYRQTRSIARPICDSRATCFNFHNALNGRLHYFAVICTSIFLYFFLLPKFCADEEENCISVLILVLSCTWPSSKFGKLGHQRWGNCTSTLGPQKGGCGPRAFSWNLTCGNAGSQ